MKKTIWIVLLLLLTCSLLCACTDRGENQQQSGTTFTLPAMQTENWQNAEVGSSDEPNLSNETAGLPTNGSTGVPTPETSERSSVSGTESSPEAPGGSTPDGSTGLPLPGPTETSSGSVVEDSPEELSDSTSNGSTGMMTHGENDNNFISAEEDSPEELRASTQETGSMVETETEIVSEFVIDGGDSFVIGGN